MESVGSHIGQDNGDACKILSSPGFNPGRWASCSGLFLPLKHVVDEPELV